MRSLYRGKIKHIVICFIIQLLLAISVWCTFMLMQTLLIEHFGMNFFAYSYIISFFIATGVLALSLKTRGQVDNNSMLFLSLVLSACAILLSTALISPNANPSFNGALLLFIVIIVVINTLITSLFTTLAWTLMNKIFLPYQINHLMPLFTSTMLIGGIIAGCIAQFVIMLGGIANLGIVIGLFFCICAFLIFKYYIRSFSALGIYKVNELNIPSKGLFAIVLEEFKYCKHNLLGSLILLFVFFDGMIWMTLLYEFIFAVHRLYPTEEGSTAFFSNIQIAGCALIILYSLILKNKLLQWLGMLKALQIVSLFVVLGFGIMMFQYSEWGLVTFRFLLGFLFYILCTPAVQLSMIVHSENHRQNMRILSEALYSLGACCGAVLLLAVGEQQIFWICASGLMMGLLNLLIATKGVTLYSPTIVNNLLSKSLMHDTLDLLIDTKDHKVNATMGEILLSESHEYDLHDKLKIIETISRLKNTALFRVMVLVMNDPNWELRKAAIESIALLFKEMSENRIVKFWMTNKMSNIMLNDPIDIVRAKAAKFILLNTPKDTLPSIFIDIIKNKSDFSGRLIVFHILRHLSVPYSDLIELDGLYDEDPLIQAEVISYLWKYPEYRSVCKKILCAILNTRGGDNVSLAALKAVCKMYPLPDIPEIRNYLTSPNPRICLFACLACLRESDFIQASRTNTLELLLNAMSSIPDMSDEEWKSFVALLIHMKDDKILDEILFGVLDKSKDNIPLQHGMHFLADFMYREELTSEQLTEASGKIF